MNPTDLFAFRELRWFENIVVVSFLTAVAIMAVIGLAVIGGEGSTLETVGLVGAFFVAVLGIVGGGVSMARYMDQKKRLCPCCVLGLK